MEFPKVSLFHKQATAPGSVSLTPLPFSPPSPSLCTHAVILVLKEGLGRHPRRKFTRKSPTRLKLRLEGVCLWLCGSWLQDTALPRRHVCHFHKKETQAFFPQKKAPEPISRLALSRRFGLITTRLTSKAHRGPDPRPLQWPPPVYLLFLRRNGSLPPFFGNPLVSPNIILFEQCPPSPEDSVFLPSLTVFPSPISVHAVCTCMCVCVHMRVF